MVGPRAHRPASIMHLTLRTISTSHPQLLQLISIRAASHESTTLISPENRVLALFAITHFNTLDRTLPAWCVYNLYSRNFSKIYPWIDSSLIGPRENRLGIRWQRSLQAVPSVEQNTEHDSVRRFKGSYLPDWYLVGYSVETPMSGVL